MALTLGIIGTCLVIAVAAVAYWLECKLRFIVNILFEILIRQAKIERRLDEQEKVQGK